MKMTAKEFIQAARAQGHDSLHVANDPEAVSTLEALARERFYANPSQETLEAWMLVVQSLADLLLPKQRL